MKSAAKNALLVILVFTGLFFVMAMIGLNIFTKFPGQSHKSALPPETSEGAFVRSELRHHVAVLAAEIGERNFECYDKLNAAADYIEQSLLKTGLSVTRQPYSIKATMYYNIEAEKRGLHQPDKIIVVGAHYDSVQGSPGANDNGSGVAALLSLSRSLSVKGHARTIRLVAFANEEPPFFWSKQMGSYVYAKGCKERRENITAMLSLETMGYYTDKENSQRYFPLLGFFYPSRGNFITFVSNLSSRKLLRETIASFRRHARFPSEGGALPGFLPGIYWSDQWGFWKMGYRALMITDTAFLRYPYYHTAHDTPEKIDYESMSRVVAGLERVVDDLAGIDGIK